MFLVEDEPSGVEMTFLGADTKMLAAWADHAARCGRQFEDGQYHVRFYEKDFLGRVQERVATVDPEVAGNGVRDADGDISTQSIFETAYASYRGGYGEIEEGGPFDPESWSDRDGAVPRDTVSTHVYVVTDVREDGRVVLQNPWGPDGGFQAGDDVHKPGELVLTEEEYRERFQNVTVTEGSES